MSKLTDADSENHEIEHWLLTAERDGYITNSECIELVDIKREVGRMLGSMIQSPSPFLLN